MRRTTNDLESQLHFLKNEIDIKVILDFISKVGQFQNMNTLLQGNAFFVFDYLKRRHILLHGQIEQVIGYHPRDFLDGGIDFFEDIFNADDYKIFTTKCFANILKLFEQEKHNSHTDYFFEMNYRVRDKNDSTHSILQRGSYITDPISKLPLFSFGTCSDISFYKTDTSMVQIISKYNLNENDLVQSPVSTNFYYPNQEETYLTKREKEILLWMADGFSSKQLAGKFKLSENTIMNHRKNMLRKTNTKNVAELVKHAIQFHVI